MNIHLSTFNSQPIASSKWRCARESCQSAVLGFMQTWKGSQDNLRGTFDRNQVNKPLNFTRISWPILKSPTQMYIMTDLRGISIQPWVYRSTESDKWAMRTQIICSTQLACYDAEVWVPRTAITLLVSQFMACSCYGHWEWVHCTSIDIY